MALLAALAVEKPPLVASPLPADPNLAAVALFAHHPSYQVSSGEKVDLLGRIGFTGNNMISTWLQAFRRERLFGWISAQYWARVA
ncbi:MAG TPA: hypothetical protein VGK73_02915 [Polyangiaceae bacterium]